MQRISEKKIIHDDLYLQKQFCSVQFIMNIIKSNCRGTGIRKLRLSIDLRSAFCCFQGQDVADKFGEFSILLLSFSV